MKQARFWLAILFLVVFTSQATYTVDVIRELAGSYPAAPVAIGGPWPTVYRVDYGDSVRAGDRVLAIEGVAPVGDRDLARALRARQPGDVLHLTVLRNGQRVECAVRLLAWHEQWLYTIVWHLTMPWLCIALGFWVVTVRSRDVRAWAVLGILVGVCQIYPAAQYGWPPALSFLSIFYQHIALRAWPAGMLLFGIYFPQRWRLERRAPWVKWVVLLALAVFGIWDGIRQGVASVNYAAAARLPNPVPVWLDPTLISLAISGFFLALGSRAHDTKAPLAPDDLRRVRLLHGGAQAALTPFSFVFFYTLFVRHDFPHGGTMLGVALMATILLPITMAYVILVERALDVRVVIRQGLQYALARGGIRVIQLAVGFGVIYLSIDLSIRFFGGGRFSDLIRYSFLGIGILLVLRLRDVGDRVRRWLDRRFFREAYNAELILSELSDRVRTILDTTELLNTVTQRIAESLHVQRIAVMLRDGPCFRPALATGYNAPLDIALPVEAPLVMRLRESRAPVASDVEGLGTQVLLPLTSKKELIGFIGLGPKRSEEPYSSSDTRLLSMVAAQTGLALENSRLSEAIAHEVTQRELLHREIEIAREVQQRLFPQNLPHLDSLDYAGHCRPALGVGGDYYDFLALPGGQLGIAIADVSGKGIPAALLMASLQASVRGQAQSGDVAGLMTGVNRLVYDASPANRYATFFYAQYDPQTRVLTWSNGGHNPPILLRDGEVIRLETGGPVVGLFPRCAYQQDSIALQCGDLLVFFTDGMSEAENPAAEEWGEDALIEAARGCRELVPQQIIEHLMHAADAFAAGAPQHDDMTLVVARVISPATARESPPDSRSPATAH